MPITQDWNPKQWSNNELIFAKDLNRIENAITLINNHATSDVGEGHIVFTNQNEWNETPTIYAIGDNDLGGGIFYKHADNSSNLRRQWYFRHEVAKPSPTETIYEEYHLPISNNSITTSVDYDILTTKYSGIIQHNVSMSAVEVPSGSNLTTIGTITVPSSNHTQKYILIVSCWWGSNSDGSTDDGIGIRRLGIATEDRFNNDRTCTVSQPACSGIATDQQLTTIFQVAGNSTDLVWKINAKHTSTNKLYARPGYRLISIT